MAYQSPGGLKQKRNTFSGQLAGVIIIPGTQVNLWNIQVALLTGWGGEQLNVDVLLADGVTFATFASITLTNNSIQTADESLLRNIAAAGQVALPVTLRVTASGNLPVNGKGAILLAYV